MYTAKYQMWCIFMRISNRYGSANHKSSGVCECTCMDWAYGFYVLTFTYTHTHIINTMNNTARASETDYEWMRAGMYSNTRACKVYTANYRL